MGSGWRSVAHIAFAGILAMLALPVAEAQAPQKTVLTLHAAGRAAPTPVIMDPVIQRTLADGLRGTLDYYSEYVDDVRFADPEFRNALGIFLKQKYADRRFDVVIATDDSALELVRVYADLFAGVPVVYQTRSGVKPRPHSTGITSTMDLSQTLALVRELQPEVKRVFVAVGASAADKGMEALARAQFRTFEERFEIGYLSGLPMTDLLGRVASLPPDSIVFLLPVREDSSGERFLGVDANDRIAAAANVPTYSFHVSTFGRGVLGGSFYDPGIVAERLAELALRVLEGEQPEDIPVIHVDVQTEEVDWRELGRWGIREARVPTGTTIRFRDPGLWERYSSYIVATLALLLLQTILITGLLVQRVRLRISESALHKSNEQNQDLAGRLITAQEAERTRIARDLHDDVSQQLAGLGIMLSGLRRRLGQPGSDGQVDETLTAVQERASALADNVRSLSHELHSGVLQHAGLVAALREHCAEIGRFRELDIAFEAEDNIGQLDPAVALCLYRTAQEALTNTTRHARARGIRVRLARTPGAIQLEVVDDGVGFDTDRQNGHGLGLRSLRERVRLAGGVLDIQSQPGRGTTVQVSIPVPQ